MNLAHTLTQSAKRWTLARETLDLGDLTWRYGA
jgi:hypothetical protein